MRVQLHSRIDCGLPPEPEWFLKDSAARLSLVPGREKSRFRKGRAFPHIERPSRRNFSSDIKAMADEQIKTTQSNPGDEDLGQSELAHSIIEALLDHTRVVSDLIALMAQALDEDTTKALIQTPQWQAYLESRRRMETTREKVEKFVEMIKEVQSE
jgi:hypothetical protein